MAQQQQKSRRNRIDILKQILEESANGISKTKLVSRCNLNFGSIEWHLEFLVRRNFLRTIQSGNANLLYRITQEGSYALDAIRIAEKIIALKPGDQESTINRHDIAADSAPPPRTSSSKRGGGSTSYLR